MNKTTMLAALATATLLTVGCTGGSDPEPAPTVTVTETVTATPEAVEEESPPDEWVEEARNEHLYDLGDWYREYFEADCVAWEVECYDLFAEGIPLMRDYSDWLDSWDSDEIPDYVHWRYPHDVRSVALGLELWSYACPDGNDCEQRALDSGSAAFEVIVETSDW